MVPDDFWWNHNAWWKDAAKKMAEDEASDAIWTEAIRRLAELCRRVPEAEGMSVHDREDLIGDVLLKLRAKEGMAGRLAEVDTPAHYLARVMRNEIVSKAGRERSRRRLSERHAESIETSADQRPDVQAA